MIFGRTSIQQKASQDVLDASAEAKCVKWNDLTPTVKFLLVPRRLRNGRWAWLTTVVHYRHYYVETGGTNINYYNIYEEVIKIA